VPETVNEPLLPAIVPVDELASPQLIVAVSDDVVSPVTMSEKVATWPEKPTFCVAENDVTETANCGRHAEDTQISPVDVGLQAPLHEPQLELSLVVLTQAAPQIW
jgi:hypothetical protein